MVKSAGSTGKATRMGSTVNTEGRRPRGWQKWETWENLNDKRWIVLVEKRGGKEDEMKEWDLVEEFFHRIQDLVRTKKKKERIE